LNLKLFSYVAGRSVEKLNNFIRVSLVQKFPSGLKKNRIYIGLVWNPELYDVVGMLLRL
jgi:hypothetical protein